MKYGFIHEWASPYDHDSNPEIERDIRTIFEGVSTSMEASGAPSYFWAEPMHHFVFTKNVLPTIPVQVDGKTEYKSPHNILNPGARPFNLVYLVAFVLFLNEKKRTGGKEPSQHRSFKGVIIGYVLNMDAY